MKIKNTKRKANIVITLLIVISVAIFLQITGCSDISSPTLEPEPTVISTSTTVSIDTALPATPTELVLPTPTPSPPEILDRDTIRMVLIPGGEFVMGSDTGEEDEKPAHSISLEPFYMDVFEITNGLYKACVDSGNCSEPRHENKGGYTVNWFKLPKFENHPVVFVDWNQAKDYCEWRGGDLPSEAQWEKAARGSSVDKIYPWGDAAPICQQGAENGAKYDDDDKCNDTGTESVGSYSPNGYGLYDMAGNAWEWTGNWYDAYPGNTEHDFDFGNTYRVVRGGSWNGNASYLEVSERHRFHPNNHLSYISFRCVRLSP